jgi:hypothetical protein
MKRSTFLHWSVWKLCGACVLLALLLGATRPASAQQPIRIMFLHHSTGHNLIEEGGVREAFAGLGYEFYDHGYNDDGLRLADGTWTGADFDVPDDNTDPDGFAVIFDQALHDPPDNTFSYLMQYDVIAFKSCFPTSNIGDDGQLADYQSYYLSIRDRMDQHPDKLFIVVTPPPQVPRHSDPEEAARARAFADWLKSDEYLAGHPNVFTFDFFDQLAGDDDFLLREYRTGPRDAHPNETANSAIGPLFVDFIDDAIQSYELEAMRGVVVEPVAQAAPAGEAVAEVGGASPPVGLIDNFESAVEPWVDSDSPDSVVECGSDTGFAHAGTASLRFHYDIAPGGWVDCGQSFEATQDWSGGTGLALWYMADTADEWVTLALFSGDSEDATPFELSFETTAQSVNNWTPVSFAWEDFEKAEWADADGITQVDPARMIGYGFSVGADGARNEGIIWIDEVGLSGGTGQPSGVAAVPAESAREEEGGGGLCPVAMMLPLGALGLIGLSRRRRT